MNKKTSVRDVATTVRDELEHKELVNASEVVQAELNRFNQAMKGKKGKARSDLLDEKQTLV